MDSERELRPGDEGFDGFQRQLPENCAEYMLFILEDQKQTDARKTISSLEAVRKEAVRLADEVAGDYIWQRGSFSLETKNEQGTARPITKSPRKFSTSARGRTNKTL